MYHPYETFGFVCRADCKTCDVGQYQEIKYTDTFTAPTLSCKECPSGYVPKEPISSTCVSCTMGKEFVAIDQPCTDCASGKYQDINATSFEASEQCCVEFDNKIETGRFYNPLKINPNSMANWACFACTFLNDDDLPTCELCETARPAPPAVEYIAVRGLFLYLFTPVLNINSYTLG